MIGQTIGKYRFVERLGRGGMGTVYKAIDETLDREVAVKVLNPELTDEEVMKRFRAEATTLAKLNHPEIATIHEIHRTDSDLLMVMELVRGETLDQLSMRCGPLPAERAAYLVAQILGALEHAHRAGIVHRDLKPANLMVTEHGGVKIMDFGIARVAGSEHLTNDGHMMGTPAYMAPEQVMTKDVDGRADIYACGVVFYRLLTGNLPFEADTAIGMVQKQLSHEPTPVHNHRADLPDWCGHVLSRALAKSPADRYQTAAEFQHALQTAISSAATEHTGVYAANRLQGLTPPPMRTASVMAVSAVAEATPAALPAPPLAAAPSRTATVPAVATAAPSPVVAPAAAPKVAKTNPATEGSTIIIQRNHFAMAGGLLAVVAVGVVVLAFIALRRPADAPAATAPSTDAGAPAATATPEAPAPPVSEPPLPPPAPSAPVASAPVTPAAAPPSGPATSTSPTPSSGAPPAATTAARPPTTPSAGTARKAEAAPVVDAKATAPPAAAPPPVETVAPFTFEAKTVVVEAGKNRERDASVVIGDGKITVTDKNKRVVSAVPYEAVLGLFYSNSKQPMWNSPSGPAEAVRVESGAFGFLKGGRNWLVMHTKEASVVLRVEDEQTRRVLTAIEERSGHKVERIVEPKGR